MLKPRPLAGHLRTWVAVGLVGLGGWGTRVRAESPAVSPNEELVETTFEERRAAISEGTALTAEERQALWGKGVLAGTERDAYQRSWRLFEAVAEQYIDTELNFATPEGSVIPLPPRRLTLAAKAGQIMVNQVTLKSAKKEDPLRSPGFYLLPIDKGIQLLVIRAAVQDYRTSLGALACMNVVYEQLKGLERLPGEDDQVPLVAQQATFSLQSLAYGSYQSGVKPGVVRVRLDKIVGFPPPSLKDDQGVGSNPSARLVYEPMGKSEPQRFGDSGIVEASSSYQITAHAWSGDEVTKTIADSLTIRRIAVDGELRRLLQFVAGSKGRLKGPIECVFARWGHVEEVKRVVDKQGELHALIQRIEG